MTPVERDPARLAEALPWYLNGTLSASDRAWVEQTLRDEEAAGRGDASRQLELDRRLAEALDRKLEEIPADIGWARLVQRVRADGAPAGPAARLAAATPSGTSRTARKGGMGSKGGEVDEAGGGGSWLQRLARLVSSFMSPQLGMAMAALLAIQTIALGVLMTQQQGNGRSDSVEYRAGGGRKPVAAIRALMNESITEKAMREALTANGASIVEGPNPLGEYWIVTGARDPDAVANSLRDAGVIASYVIDQRLQGR